MMPHLLPHCWEGIICMQTMLRLPSEQFQMQTIKLPLASCWYVFYQLPFLMHSMSRRVPKSLPMEQNCF